MLISLINIFCRKIMLNLSIFIKYSYKIEVKKMKEKKVY